MNSEQQPAGRPVACAFCGSTDTEFFALFSQFLLASQYYCRRCKSVFDVVRWEDATDSGHGDALPTSPRPSSAPADGGG